MPTQIPTELWAVLGTFGSVLISAVVTYKVAVTNARKDMAVNRESYVDSSFRTLIDTYQKEVTELRADITVLIKENQLLREEILGLKTKIVELEGITNEGKNV